MPRPTAAPQCANPTCPPLRGQHTPACYDTDQKCDGCLPRLAADSLRLCTLCTRLVAEHPTTLVIRYRDLERVLTTTASPGEHVQAKGRDPNLKLNAAAADARHQIRTTLTRLVRLITHERGLHLPTLHRPAPRPPGFIGPMPLLSYVDTSIPALARLVTRHAEWLAAHRQAGQHAATLADLVRHTHGIAHPTGVREFPVADCPGQTIRRLAFIVDTRGVTTQRIGPTPCGGTLWTSLRPHDDQLPAELACNGDTMHYWPVRDWLRKLGPVLKKIRDAAAAAAAAATPPAPPAAVDRLAGVHRVATGHGFDLVCRTCKEPVGRADWGVPDTALEAMLARHLCASVPAVSGSPDRTAA